MSRFFFVAASAASASAAVVPPMGLAQRASAVILNAEVTSGVASQVKMVEQIIKQLESEHRQITGPEKDTLQLVEDTLQKTTLPNIDLADKADRELLANSVQEIKRCDDDLKENSELGAAKSDLDNARSALSACRTKEKDALTFKDASEKNLNDHVADIAQGPGKAVGCSLPAASALDDEGDAVDDFMKQSLEWYVAAQAKTTDLTKIAEDAATAYRNQAAECNETYQPDFESKYCAWTAVIVRLRQDYQKCRTDSSQSLDGTYNEILEKIKHRKADFGAVNRVLCLLRVLMMDTTGDEHNAELDKCLNMAYDVEHLNIEKPAVPPADEGLVAGLGDISSPEVNCQNVEE